MAGYVYSTDGMVDDLLGAGRPRTLSELKASVQAAPGAVDTSRGYGLRANDPWRGRSLTQEREADSLSAAADVLNPVAQGEGLADAARSGYRLATGGGTADDIVNVGAAIAMGRVLAGRGAPLFEYSVKTRGGVPRTGVAPMGAPAVDRRAFSGATRKVNSMKKRFLSGDASTPGEPQPAARSRPVRQRFTDYREARRHPDDIRPDPVTTRDWILRDDSYTPVLADAAAADAQAFRSGLKDAVRRQTLAEMRGAPEILDPMMDRMTAGVYQKVLGPWLHRHPGFAKSLKIGLPATVGVMALADASNNASLAARKAEDEVLARAHASSRVDQAMMRLARHEAASTNEAAVASFWSAPDKVIVDELGQLVRDVGTIREHDPANAPPQDVVMRIFHNYGHTPAPHRDRFTGAELPDYSDQYNALVEALRAKEAENAQR